KVASKVNRADKQSECYGKQEGVTDYDSTERYPRSVITFASDKQHSNLHPTQKPVALMEYLIKTYTNEGETVLDFTMGSCSTGVACANAGRKFIGIELDLNYFNIALERIEAAHGL
ncbi:MAG: DNA-methyltransferase, partial [Shewanella sp.]